MHNGTPSYHMSRDLARLMLVMRRFIKEEFSVTIHLDAPEAADELLAFAGRSGNGMLQEMAKELEDLITPFGAPLETAGPAAATGLSYYRGAPMPRQTESGRTPEPVPAAAKRIYRGQVVG